MSGATSVIASLTFTNNNFAFLGGITITPFYVDSIAVASIPLSGNSTTVSGNTLVNIAPGAHTFSMNLGVTEGTTLPPEGSVIGNFTLTFNDTPQTILNGNIIFLGLTIRVIAFIRGTISCIHGSSLIETRQGLKKIRDLTNNDEILSGQKLDTYVRIDAVAQCWIKPPGPRHDAIIFEPNSLGENQPEQRLIIDPGHPMCTKKDYLEKGIKCLRPAGSYLQENNDKIYVRKWTDKLVQDDESVRYDLVLPKPYITYVANGIVVQTAGYAHHGYENLI